MKKIHEVFNSRSSTPDVERGANRVVPLAHVAFRRLRNDNRLALAAEPVRAVTVFLSLLLLSLAFSGCVLPTKTQDIGLGQRFSVAEVPLGKCRLVVFWPSDNYKASGIQPNVLVQGVDIGGLKPLGYLDTIVNPGDVSVAVSYEGMQNGSKYTMATNVNATADSEVYVAYDPNPQGGVMGWQPRLSLTVLEQAAGRESAVKTRRSQLQ